MQASYVEVRIVLANLNFPLRKQELIQQAIKHGATKIIIEDLKNIPDIEYISFNSIVKELGRK
jgi:hypothetical protein